MTDHVNSRELVLSILLSVIKDQEYSHIALHDVLTKYGYLSKQERSFITRLSEGTLERMIELDYVIDQYSNTKVSKMKSVICCILRMGVYQILYMNAIPDSAACNEAVRLAEKKGFRNLKGFVNGVLRTVSRNADHIPYPDEITDHYAYLSVKYAMPVWIIRQWETDYGISATRKILESFYSGFQTTIRTNLLRITPSELMKNLQIAGVTVEPVVYQDFPELTYAFRISDYDNLASLSSFQKGEFSVQDISSMLVAEIAGVKDNDYVIDVCAAPGGKSIHIAEKMHGTGMVEARDLTEYKVSLIKDTIQRLQISNVRTKQMDATVFDEGSVEAADILIADLPCSGLGVMRRKTDIKYKMTPEKEADLAALQKEILSVVYRYVKIGGHLLFSTCTLNKQENEDNTIWFLNQFPEFEKVSERQIFPFEEDGDGFYIAKFKRKSSAG
ncbi:MAG: 16S rRNA (cytosine(967)-C(5))-methyltransferase RsmB [Lachnospiraceae bacterium]